MRGSYEMRIWVMQICVIRNHVLCRMFIRKFHFTYIPAFTTCQTYCNIIIKHNPVPKCNHQFVFCIPIQHIASYT